MTKIHPITHADGERKRWLDQAMDYQAIAERCYSWYEEVKHEVWVWLAGATEKLAKDC